MFEITVHRTQWTLPTKIIYFTIVIRYLHGNVNFCKADGKNYAVLYTLEPACIGCLTQKITPASGGSLEL